MSYGENEFGESTDRKEVRRLKHNEKQNMANMEI